MGFYIQDDFWECIEDQPATVRNLVLGALTELFFTGECSQRLTGISKAVYIALRERVLIARKKSIAGKSKSKQNGNQNEIKTESKQDQKHYQKRIKSTIKNESKALSKTNQNEDDLLKSESESKSKREKEIKKKEKKKEKSPPFTHPSIDEVKNYCKEQGLQHCDAQRFVDYFAAQGWKLSNGNPMKDWKAAARNWNRRGGDSGVQLSSEFNEYF